MLLLRGRWKKAITQHVYFRLAPRGFGFAAAVACTIHNPLVSTPWSEKNKPLDAPVTNLIRSYLGNLVATAMQAA